MYVAVVFLESATIATYFFVSGVANRHHTAHAESTDRKLDVISLQLSMCLGSRFPCGLVATTTSSLTLKGPRKRYN